EALTGEVRAGEEETELDLGGLRSVAAVDGVALDVGAVGVPDGPGGRLLGVRGPPHLAVAGDGALPLDGHYHAGAGGHELDEGAVEGAVLVDGVEGLRLRLAEADQPERDDLEPRLLDEVDDAADRVLGDGIGFDDSERSLDGHGLSFSPETLVLQP